MSEDVIRIGKVEIAQVVGVVSLKIHQNPFIDFHITPREAKKIGEAMIEIADNILKECDGRGSWC